MASNGNELPQGDPSPKRPANGKKPGNGKPNSKDPRSEEARTRNQIAKGVMLLIAVFLVGAAGYGVYAGNFEALSILWHAVGPIAGGVLTYYFIHPNGSQHP